MLVKGTAFIARKTMIEHELGAGRFADVLRKVAETEPVFRAPILATTRIPIEPFLRFNEVVVHDLYHGDVYSYFRFGEMSAAWGLGGPYKHLVTNKSVPEFVASAPGIYRNYFSEGEAKGALDGDDVTLRIFGIDVPYRHVYFEYGITGYFNRGLELVTGRKITMTRERGFSKGDADVLYHFAIG
jgi:hypothetical protein